jgi:tetratricopeptide (TPR) repeat protein
MVAVLAVTLLVTVGVRRAAQERERAIAAETAANTERQLREAQAAAEAARAKALALSVEAERLAARDLARRQAERELSDRRRWAAETAAIEAENTRKAAAERKYQRELERSRAESQVRTRSTKVTKERQLLKARATDLRRRLDLAEGFFESGDFASCMAEAAKIIALDASEPEGWILRARAHLALNERDAAVGAYERALDCPLGPDRRKVVLEALDALEAYRPIDDYAE